LVLEAVDVIQFTAEVACRTGPNCAAYLNLIELEVFVQEKGDCVIS